jgi:hypothetical protein
VPYTLNSQFNGMSSLQKFDPVTLESLGSLSIAFKRCTPVEAAEAPA